MTVQENLNNPKDIGKLVIIQVRGKALLANTLNDAPSRLSTVLKASENQYYIYVVRLKRRAAPRAGLESCIPRTARYSLK